MPRPRVPGSAEPKKRSRTGCWPCKSRKIKCDEARPQCQNCLKQSVQCDYSVRLNWGGRSKKSQDESTFSINATRTTVTPAVSSSNLPNNAAAWNVNSRRQSDSSNSAPIVRDQSSIVQPPRQWQPSTPFDRTALPSEPPQQPRLPSFAQFSSHATSGWNQHDSDRPGAIESDAATADSAADASTANDSSLLARSDLVLPPLSRPDFSWSSQHAIKRRKLSPFDPNHALYDRGFARPMLPEGTASPAHFDHPSPASTHYTNQSFNGLLGAPMTPGSSVQSEDAPKAGGHGSASLSIPKVRRLSVNSLLSGPPGDDGASSYFRPVPYRKVLDDGFVAYGYDYGHPDFDIPKNDDKNAIAPQSPSSSRTVRPNASGASTFMDENATRPQAFERGGYYAHPVQIKISPHLEPLPHYVTENPMNLLYFHHFLNHTARVLVPLDCPENPLRKVLPQMACRNANVMNLLLSYSASHRAKLLEQPEPANRIALWVRDVFPDLRTALSFPAPIPDETLATAVMLASLEVIIPNAFGVAITWQSHLHVARSIIESRGGIYKLGHSDDEHVAFLCKWFTYLDVLGSLSGGSQVEVPMSGESWEVDEPPSRQNRRIDCFLGCTSRCLALLARVARLSAECDSKRLDGAGNIRLDWSGPGKDIEDETALLKTALRQSLSQIEGLCIFRQDLGESKEECSQEARGLYAANEMFHWAGLIHLNRRVLGKPTTDPEVQSAVKKIVTNMDSIVDGSTTALSVIYPLFTAGCDTIDQTDRDKVMDRLKGAEGWGMTNVAQARRLMQEVWDSGKPWETLVAGEFFG